MTVIEVSQVRALLGARFTLGINIEMADNK